MTFVLHEIGLVRKTQGRLPQIVIHQSFCEALLNVDRFSHIIVLWWISGRDTDDDRSTLVVTPIGGRIPERSGVFSCRSPSRPNPIGHSIVQVVSVDMAACTIVVDQIDANDGTPILDIKPYLPSSDRVENAVVAPWFSDLEHRYE
ncbi:MAG: tRNA (N6-threonylcarbamoyladenosine(37)-N6)-methyltransferase TrmO [Candidatus Thorarchaeota archaeon]|nr:tRNA (N6-threonylcarbamoyladenosine(37)-N6)-methyltransferase TrmO [Candidatus Thorarchaeota archaeon]